MAPGEEKEARRLDMLSFMRRSMPPRLLLGVGLLGLPCAGSGGDARWALLVPPLRWRSMATPGRGRGARQAKVPAVAAAEKRLSVALSIAWHSRGHWLVQLARKASTAGRYCGRVASSCIVELIRQLLTKKGVAAGREVPPKLLTALLMEAQRRARATCSGVRVA